MILKKLREIVNSSSQENSSNNNNKEKIAGNITYNGMLDKKDNFLTLNQ